VNIILLGLPGSGKGTQAQFISERFNLERIAPGDILRDEIKNKSVLGKKASVYVGQGKLVPDDIIINMIKNRIEDANSKSGFILDGFPRNTEQAESLDRMLKSTNRKIDRVIYFNASEKKVIERLSGRLVCRRCGKIHHIKYTPPKVEFKCDECGGDLYQRDDDKPEVIEKRLDTYKKETSPIIDYYKKKNYYLEINANDTIKDIKKNILKELGD